LLRLPEVEQVFEKVLALLLDWATVLVITDVTLPAAVVIVVIVVVTPILGAVLPLLHLRLRSELRLWLLLLLLLRDVATLALTLLELALGVVPFGAHQPLQLAAIKEDTATLGAAIHDDPAPFDRTHRGQALRTLQVG